MNWLREWLSQPDEQYSPSVMFVAGGQLRQLVTCNLCGAALLLDPETDVRELHSRWHWRIDSREP